MSDLAPNGIRSFPVKYVKMEQATPSTLGVQLGGQGMAQYVLLRASLPDDDPYEIPLMTRLSSIIREHPITSPDSTGNYKFFIKTYSENEGVLDQLIAAGIVELDNSVQPIKQGFVTFPLVKVKIPLSEMAKQCGSCERWEVATDEKRMSGCSKCKPESKTWYCDKECQVKHWKEGYPAHKKVCGK